MRRQKNRMPRPRTAKKQSHSNRPQRADFRKMPGICPPPSKPCNAFPRHRIRLLAVRSPAIPPTKKNLRRRTADRETKTMTKRISNCPQRKPAKRKPTRFCQIAKTNKQNAVTLTNTTDPQPQKPLRLNLFFQKISHSAVAKLAAGRRFTGTMPVILRPPAQQRIPNHFAINHKTLAANSSQNLHFPTLQIQD